MLLICSAFPAIGIDITEYLTKKTAVKALLTLSARAHVGGNMIGQSN